MFSSPGLISHNTISEYILSTWSTFTLMNRDLYLILIYLIFVVLIGTVPVYAQSADDWYGKGLAFYDMEQYEDTNTAFDESIRINENSSEKVLNANDSENLFDISDNSNNFSPEVVNANDVTIPSKTEETGDPIEEQDSPAENDLPPYYGYGETPTIIQTPESTPEPAIVQTAQSVPGPMTGMRISGSLLSLNDAYLTISNAIDKDAIVILTDDGSTIPIVSYFIAKGDSYTIDGIPIGTYNLYYELGTEWDGIQKRFSDGTTSMFATYSGFPEPIPFDASIPVNT